MAADRHHKDGPRPVTGGELQAVLRAEHAGEPFFIYRDSDSKLLVVPFDQTRIQLAIGRSPAADLSIGWDEQVSSLHGVVQRIAGELTLLDDGLSRNGSYLNGEPVRGIRRLQDGDILRLGNTLVLVRNPSDSARSPTLATPGTLVTVTLSEQQRKVLIALCRPARDDSAFVTPPANQEIAAELYLSVAAVKLHLRALFHKFAVADLPQNKKRVALVKIALQSGVLSDQDRRPDVS